MGVDIDLKYLELAIRLAKNSPDPSTQNGAILVNRGNIIGQGVNEFPRGVRYTQQRWERPRKYSFIEHAERNAIYDAAKQGYKIDGSTLYCPWFACSDCARAIIQVGIERCVGYEDESNLTNERWLESILIGNEMFDEAGVEHLNLRHPFGVELRRDGKIIII